MNGDHPPSPQVRYPLLVFNLALWLIGCLLLALAFYLYLSASDSAEDEATLSRIDLSGILIGQVQLVVLLAGASLFLVSFCGCVGALRENSFLLKCYSLAVTALILLNMVFALVVFFMPMHGFLEHLISWVVSRRLSLAAAVRKVIKETLSESLVIHYRDTMDTQSIVDALQRQLHCCGMTAKSFRDWEKNIYFECSMKNPSHERCSVPHSCCKTNSSSGGIVSIKCGRNVLNMSDYDAWFVVNIGNCPDAANRYIKENVMIIGGSCLIAVILLAFVDMITNSVIDEINIIRKIYEHVNVVAEAEP
ncbi:tetraspanin-33-like [Haemaphysalis longicornis]